LWLTCARQPGIIAEVDRKEYMRQYRRDHPEKFSAANKKYRAKPEAKAKQREQQAEWRRANKSKVRTYNRRYSQNNPVKMADRKQAWLDRKSSTLSQGKPRGSFRFQPPPHPRPLPPIPPRPVPQWILDMPRPQALEWFTEYRQRPCALLQHILVRRIADATAYSPTPVAPSACSLSDPPTDVRTTRHQ
jgi:hypothetical protein